RYLLVTGTKLAVVDLKPEQPAQPGQIPSWFKLLQPLPPPKPPPPPPIVRDGKLDLTLTYQGKPVPHAKVVLTPGQDEWDNARKLHPITARTNTKGELQLRHLPRIDWVFA